MLEDTSGEKWRCDPDGSERRNFLEKDRRLRRREDRRSVRLLVFSGGKKGDGALVVRRTGISVKTRVQLGRRGEREGKEKGAKQATRDDRAKCVVAAHAADTFRREIA